MDAIQRDVAAMADDARRIYAMQFHPEVVHTPDGAKLIANFARHVCGLTGDWTMAEFRAAKVAEMAPLEAGAMWARTLSRAYGACDFGTTNSARLASVASTTGIVTVGSPVPGAMVPASM